MAVFTGSRAVAASEELLHEPVPPKSPLIGRRLGEVSVEELSSAAQGHLDCGKLVDIKSEVDRGNDIYI